MLQSTINSKTQLKSQLDTPYAQKSCSGKQRMPWVDRERSFYTASRRGHGYTPQMPLDGGPYLAHPESKLLALRCITRRTYTHALKKYFTAGTCLAVLYRRAKMIFPGSPCVLLTSAMELTLSPINTDSIYRGVKLGNQDLDMRLSHSF